MKLLIVLVLLFSFNVFAKDNSSGCGLGWSVLKKNSLVSSSFRFTTHVVLPNTLSMTSGTSGCAKHSIVKNESKGIHFAEGNYHQLVAEMAQGNGEVLKGFAEVVEYKGDMQQFGMFVQENYQRLFPTRKTTPVQMYNNFKSVVSDAPGYAII